MAHFALRLEFNDEQVRRLVSSRRFRTVLNKHASRQFLPMGRTLVTRVQRMMRNNSFPEQGYAQTRIKGHARTLFFSGGLYNSIKFRYLRRGYLRGIEVFVNEGSYGSITRTKLAMVQHQGTRWHPSPQQRKAVMIKLRNAGADLPEGGGSPLDYWEIPSRPFFMEALSGADIPVIFGEYVTRAVYRSLREMGWTGRG